MRPRRPLHAAAPVLLAVVAALAPATAARAQVNARLLRQPDVSETRITFVYGNDVWVVDKEGGTAHRLSSPEGPEQFPRFSPDGSTVAFSGNYDGNVDVYTIPAGGGVPTRVTHHPEQDRLVDWTPDGEGLLFASQMTSGRERYSQFWRVSPEGGMPERLPVAYGEMGAISPDGSTLAFTPESRLFRTWKRYRGGAAADVWLFDLEEETAERVTDHVANDEMPMWAGGTLYFLSDRGPSRRYNLWAHDLETGEKRQVTDFADVDVHFPAAGPSDLVFEAGGRLHLMDLETEEVRPVEVDVVTDRPGVKPRTVEVGDAIEHMDVSPSGKRALFEARGNLYTVPAEHGPVRPLTRTSGAAERHPAWSPDGEKVAYFSDASGEYELVVAPADGTGEPRTVTSLGPGYRYTPQWGPRSERVVFVDDTKTIRMADVETGEVTALGELLYPFHQGLAAFRVSWSPDGRWVAWDRGLENGHGAVFLYDTDAGERHRVTSEFYDHGGPVFGADGDYLFLRANRRHEPIYSDLDNSWIYANTTRIAAVPLREDVASPLAPRSDEETGAEDGDADGDDGDGGAGEGDGEAGRRAGAGGGERGGGGDGREADDGEPAPVEIDLEGFESRMVLLPAEAGNYGRLAALPGKVLYHRAPRTGSADEEAPLVLYDLEEREEKTVLEDVDAYRLSASGKKLLVEVDGRHHIVEPAPEQKLGEPLRTAEMTAELDPRAEWRQIFADAWRLYRDYFYDPGMHGVDWDGLRERYGALLEDAATRADVNFLIGELIAELNASHTYRGGGDLETPERRATGLLGVDWSLERGAYRIRRIVDGAPWDVETRSPLAEPGVDVSEGDWVLAVNGVPLDPSEDPWAAFEGLAGETVELTVNGRPTTEGARTVLVETLREDGEDRLRYLDWIDGKRRRVEELSAGRVGYVYVPNTAFTGQTELVRQFRAQVTKDALVVDERFNSGGQLADRFLELMGRRMYAYIAPRHGTVQPSPPVAHTGPQVMLINGWSGSGGDAFPWYFRTADRGPIVGTRTWGGLIGPAVGHELVDGGVVVIPPARLYGPDGEWFAEGHGVEPDIRVENDPESLAAGRDPQLERAVEEMLRALEEQGAPERPERPPFVERVPGGG